MAPRPARAISGTGAADRSAHRATSDHGRPGHAGACGSHSAAGEDTWHPRAAAQQIVAEAGPRASAFGSAAHFSSWIGVSPSSQESAGENHSSRCAKGNTISAAFSVRQPKPRSAPKTVSSSRSSGGWFPASVMSKRSGRSPATSAWSFGISCMKAANTSSTEWPLLNRP
jgi:hypothetical protein